MPFLKKMHQKITKVGSIKKSPQYSTIVKKPIKADIAINGVALSNILKLEDRVKKIKATKFAISDHKVKNLNCFPNPLSKKTLDPEKKKISSTKKRAKDKQVILKRVTSIWTFHSLLKS